MTRGQPPPPIARARERAGEPRHHSRRAIARDDPPLCAPHRARRAARRRVASSAPRSAPRSPAVDATRARVRGARSRSDVHGGVDDGPHARDCSPTRPYARDCSPTRPHARDCSPTRRHRHPPRCRSRASTRVTVMYIEVKCPQYATEPRSRARLDGDRHSNARRRHVRRNPIVHADRGAEDVRQGARARHRARVGATDVVPRRGGPGASSRRSPVVRIFDIFDGRDRARGAGACGRRASTTARSG